MFIAFWVEVTSLLPRWRGMKSPKDRLFSPSYIIFVSLIMRYQCSAGHICWMRQQLFKNVPKWNNYMETARIGKSKNNAILWCHFLNKVLKAKYNIMIMCCIIFEVFLSKNTLKLLSWKHSWPDAGLSFHPFNLDKQVAKLEPAISVRVFDKYFNHGMTYQDEGTKFSFLSFI